jgi:hypothetical protein
VDFLKVIEHTIPPLSHVYSTLYQHVLRIYHLGIFIESSVNKLCRFCLSSLCVDDLSKVAEKVEENLEILRNTDHRSSLILIRPTPV